MSYGIFPKIKHFDAIDCRYRLVIVDIEPDLLGCVMLDGTQIDIFELANPLIKSWRDAKISSPGNFSYL